MELFRVFNENMKREFLNSPLNHPNIEYKWIKKDIKINVKPYELIYIGKIIDDGNIEIINFKDAEIGFIDKNKNFVTPILLHPINLKKTGYNSVCNKIKKFVPGKDGIPENIKKLIDRLDEDVPLYMDILKYIRTNKFEFPEENMAPNKKDVDELISFLNKDRKEILNDFPHLKLMMNILENQGI